MRFVVAAGVLAKTMPSLSATNVGNALSKSRQHKQVFRYARRTANEKTELKSKLMGDAMSKPTQMRPALTKQGYLLKNQDTIECDPFSSDPDLGILSCGSSSACKPSSDALLGGKCTKDMDTSFIHNRPMRNVLSTDAKSLECVPAEGDVGILSQCQDGQHCLEDDDSTLGGFCVHTTTSSRRLFTVELCDPDSSLYQLYECECTNFESSTGTGYIACNIYDDYSAGYIYDGCDDAIYDTSSTYIFESSTLVALENCFEFSAPYYQKVCVERTTTDCEVEFNGNPCTSCTLVSEDYFDFDCTNVEVGRQGGSENILDLVPIVDACYIQQYGNCSSLCGDNSFIPGRNFDTNVTLPGFGTVSCENLAYADYYGLVPNDVCGVATQAAQGSCCVYECYLCGDGSYVPPENYDTPVLGIAGDQTCQYFVNAAYYAFSIAEDQCSNVQGLMEEFCCETVAYEPCDICGAGSVANPDANVAILDLVLSCSSLEDVALSGNLSAVECTMASGYASDVCCGEMPLPPTKDSDPPTPTYVNQTTSPSSIPTESPAPDGSFPPTDVPQPEPTNSPNSAAGGVSLCSAEDIVYLMSISATLALLVVGA